eukprot:TRINITY_DN32913_c0_g1_i1.p1 TRINITY_DN32913_c0_g1~~TRINITY_DN32913_c0_g1_i1.p1  ORF type:complete len:626 (-),score=84.74 TRINITY_DN32913_c0_g1_i1:1043-2920(-)
MQGNTRRVRNDRTRGAPSMFDHDSPASLPIASLTVSGGPFLPGHHGGPFSHAAGPFFERASPFTESAMPAISPSSSRELVGAPGNYSNDQFGDHLPRPQHECHHDVGDLRAGANQARVCEDFSATSNELGTFFSSFGRESLTSHERTGQGRERTTMIAGSSGESRRRTVRSMFNDMVRRHSRVVPLGYSRGKKASRSPSGSGGDSHPWGTSEEGGKLGHFPDQKRVLILMSDTGGGHRASAEAIKETFAQEFGDDYTVTVVDLWKEHTPWPFNQMPRGYSFAVKHETVWKLLFYGTKPRFVHQPQMAATSVFVAREVAKGLYYYRPDVIVSVHPLMQHIPLRVLRVRGLLKQIPFTTVITDLSTCHPTWFHKLATVCFCPTIDVAQRASKAGLQPPQIRVYGLPIRPDFCRPTASKDVLRRELGMDAVLPAVVLMGGGEGMGPVEATAKALARALVHGGEPIGQLIVICGRNKKLLAKLQAVNWPMPTLINGFVKNMPEWMAASDCVITKAGPGTIAEAMIRGLPIIINDYIAGQEVGNVPYVVDNGAGKFSEDPKEIASIVASWFGPNKAELERMAANCLQLARPDAVYNIVRDLDQLARRKDAAFPKAPLALTGTPVAAGSPS